MMILSQLRNTFLYNKQPTFTLLYNVETTNPFRCSLYSLYLTKITYMPDKSQKRQYFLHIHSQGTLNFKGIINNRIFLVVGKKIQIIFDSNCIFQIIYHRVVNNLSYSKQPKPLFP